MNIHKLKIMPCPVNAGRHPYHDHRWIATEDAETEWNGNDPEEWMLASGRLIAEMRDVDPVYARLFTAAPELLELLDYALRFPTATTCNSGFIAECRVAIQKATMP